MALRSSIRLLSNIPTQPPKQACLSLLYPSHRAFKMTASAASTAAGQATKAPSAPVEGNGILISASKIHTAFKTELLQTIASPEFDPKQGKAPTLVGILATKKDDAKAYSDVSPEHVHAPKLSPLTMA